MNTAFDSLTHKMQRAALGKTVDLVLSHAEKDPAKTVGQIVDLSKQFYGDSFQRGDLRTRQADPDRPQQQVVEAHQLYAEPTGPQRGPHHGPEPGL